MQDEREAAEQKLVMQGTKTDQRQQQRLAVAKVVEDALKLLHTEQSMPSTSAAIVVSHAPVSELDIRPGDVVISLGPMIP